MTSPTSKSWSVAMTRELDPKRVAERLAWLGKHYVAETVDEGRARLRAEYESPAVFASAVAQRLEELRALDDLRRHLEPAREQLRPKR
jgi:hypothetical protein